jgi:predicted nucleic acid-binding protein
MEMIKSKIKVVCDAGPVIHLDEIESLHLLNDFKTVLLPDSVYNEVLKYRPESLSMSKVEWVLVPHKASIEEPLKIICRMFSLDVGETEALAILTEEPNCIFLTDDAAARIVAEKLGFKVHGTIGVLIRAVRRNLMKPQEVIDILHQLSSKSSLYIKASLLEEAISLVKRKYNL